MFEHVQFVYPNWVYCLDKYLNCKPHGRWRGQTLHRFWLFLGVGGNILHCFTNWHLKNIQVRPNVFLYDFSQLNTNPKSIFILHCFTNWHLKNIQVRANVFLYDFSQLNTNPKSILFQINSNVVHFPNAMIH